ncbi:cbb3-type cytochrome oxidase assembly protein CcoS [Hankyongella ginsenosidimutans]|uniref:Cbb3-type cytochrome oxidase assembly protein CcoS n=1 Tax=Hankyongella ginsenosidimutans TaxID=1763828 RepID=A0A4D7CAA1_9SPHN|nr:cbb3-type cytochrome oxidase assembly protein CcoS [Hankyongella ginsenosidimutans]QCI80227.1 cbb3-type cytochrome oxidase assembly protein CcoS [Hankyongella ginsenosidimutans]
MTGLLILIPVSLLMGAVLWQSFWALRSGQFDDPEGASQRILLDDDVTGAP